MNNEEKDWKVLQAYIDNQPGVISFRTTVNTEKNRKSLPFQIGIAVPLLQPTEQGLPLDAEASQLWKIEDGLKSKLKEKYNSLYVITITVGGMREFVLYTPEWKPKEIEKTVKEIEKEINDGHELQFMLKEDSDWKTYKDFTKNPE